MKMLQDDSLETNCFELYDPDLFFENQILTTSEAARLLKVSIRTLYRRVKNDELPYKKFGRQLRFSSQALMEWVKQGG